MTESPLLRDAATTIGQSVGLLARRLRQTRAGGGLSFAESTALSSVVRAGPATSAELARLEAITPQSMGTTLAGLERRGLIVRSTDPQDGRRVVMAATAAGQAFYDRRQSVRAQQLARVLATTFDAAEIEQLTAVAPLLNRLAAGMLRDAETPDQEVAE